MSYVWRADITASLGKLKFQDADLLANLISRTAQKVSDMDAEHLSKLVRDRYGHKSPHQPSCPQAECLST